jgi:hypothetical protein
LLDVKVNLSVLVGLLADASPGPLGWGAQFFID